MVEIAHLGQLAGRVARECQRQILGQEAVAVVDDTDRLGAATGDLDPHLSRAGVERVLDQLLDHRTRALDDLTGSDLIDDRRR